jgi:hypothetical protein
VDGKQRLSSLISFVLTSTEPELLAKFDMQPFERLSGLDEGYDELNGLSFNELSPRHQRLLLKYSINYMKIADKTPKEVVFEIYSDINSGGLELSQQQARKGAFHSAYFELLEDLALRNEDFRCIFAPGAKMPLVDGVYKGDEKKETDRELILRAFSFKRRGPEYKPPMKKFLNKEANELIDDAEGLSKQKAEFESVMKVARNTFLDGAFRRWDFDKKSGEWKWSTDVCLPLWDTLYIVLAELLWRYKPQHFQDVAANLVDEMKSICEEWCVPKSTTAKGWLNLKTILTGKFEKILADGKSRKGGVALGLRSLPRDETTIRKLYDKQGGRCPLCEGAIDEFRMFDGAYAHIDHIQPYSLGGMSNVGNSQLTHAGCNLYKGNKTQA